MPYVDQASRDAIKARANAVKDPGDLNFLIFSYLVGTWLQHPRYFTIHCFKRDFVTYPKGNSLLQQLEREMSDRFTVSDIRAAAHCAYDEFMRRIGSKYEDRKIELNGDIQEVQIAIMNIEQMQAQTPSTNVPADAMDGTKVDVVSGVPAIPVITNDEVK